MSRKKDSPLIKFYKVLVTGYTQLEERDWAIIYGFLALAFLCWAIPSLIVFHFFKDTVRLIFVELGVNIATTGLISIVCLIVGYYNQQNLYNYNLNKKFFLFSVFTTFMLVVYETRSNEKNNSFNSTNLEVDDG